MIKEKVIGKVQVFADEEKDEFQITITHYNFVDKFGEWVQDFDFNYVIKNALYYCQIGETFDRTVDDMIKLYKKQLVSKYIVA